MAMHDDFALRPVPAMLDPMALEPMEITMWDVSLFIGLRGLLFEVHPLPIRISSTSPWPLSSRTARHRFPSAFRVKLTPLTWRSLLPLSSPPPTWSPVEPVDRVAELPRLLPLRSVAGEMDPPVDGAAEGPATGLPVAGPAVVPVSGPAVVPVAGPAVVPVPVPAALPPVEDEDDCGDAAFCGVGVELSPVPVDVWLTEVEAGVDVGVVVLFVSEVTAGAAGLA